MLAAREAAALGVRGAVKVGVDSAILAAAGIPTVVFGPSGAGSHADVEWVDLASAASATPAALACTAEFCA